MCGDDRKGYGRRLAASKPLWGIMMMAMHGVCIEIGGVRCCKGRITSSAKGYLHTLFERSRLQVGWHLMIVSLSMPPMCNVSNSRILTPTRIIGLAGIVSHALGGVCQSVNGSQRVKAANMRIAVSGRCWRPGDENKQRRFRTAAYEPTQPRSRQLYEGASTLQSGSDFPLGKKVQSEERKAATKVPPPLGMRRGATST